MNLKPGTATTFLVSSVSGRVVATFEKRIDLGNWVRARKGNGVTYRIFEQKATTTELGSRRRRPLRLVRAR